MPGVGSSNAWNPKPSSEIEMPPFPVPMGEDPEMELFEAALDVPTSERAAWLATACGESIELLQRVRERLAWEARMNGFLLSPIVLPADEDSPFLSGDVAGWIRDGNDGLAPNIRHRG